MRHWRIWLYLIGITGILAFCLYASLPAGFALPRAARPAETSQQANTPAGPATEAPEVEEVAQVTEAAVSEATDAPAEEPAVEPTEEPTQTEVAAAEQVDFCVECHTDKDQLIDTAALEEEVVEESEGAG